MNASIVAHHTTSCDLRDARWPEPLLIQPLACDRPLRDDPQCWGASHKATSDLRPVREAAELEHHKLWLVAVQEAGLDGKPRSEMSRCHATS